MIQRWRPTERKRRAEVGKSTHFLRVNQVGTAKPFENYFYFRDFFFSAQPIFFRRKPEHFRRICAESSRVLMPDSGKQLTAIQILGHYLLCHKFLHLNNCFVEVQVNDVGSKYPPVGSCQPVEQHSQCYKIVVDLHALTVQKNALLLPIQGRHIGVHESGDITLIEVEACTHFKQIVESV